MNPLAILRAALFGNHWVILDVMQIGITAISMNTDKNLDFVRGAFFGMHWMILDDMKNCIVPN